MIKPELTQAFVIDFQERLVPAMSNPDSTVFRASQMIRGLTALNVPILATRQYPKGLGEFVEPILSDLKTTQATIIDKLDFGCLSEPEFRQNISPDRSNWIVFGVEAHVCVLQTVLQALTEEGIQKPDNIYVVMDATDSRHESDKSVAFDRMRQQGIIVTTTESVLFELIGSARHPSFKAISKIVKEG